MSSTNLKEQSVEQLKALAYDLSEFIQQYTQMLNTVNQEIQLRRNQQAEANKRAEEQMAKKNTDPSPNNLTRSIVEKAESLAD